MFLSRRTCQTVSRVTYSNNTIWTTSLRMNHINSSSSSSISSGISSSISSSSRWREMMIKLKNWKGKSGRVILLGAGLTGLLADSYKQYHLSPHEPKSNPKSEFERNFGISQSRWKYQYSKACLVGIIGINVMVFLGWRANYQFMSKHFLTTIENIQAKRYHVLLTSNWSHVDWWHVGINMYVLYSFGDLLISQFGIPAFLSIYTLSGLAGSSLSLAWAIVSRSPSYASLGASSGITGMIMMFALMEPEALLHLIFLPNFTFHASTGVGAIIALDFLGVVRGWRFFDHAAHMGGWFTGYLAWQYMRRRYGTCHNRIQSSENNASSEPPCRLVIGSGKYIFEGDYVDFKPATGQGVIYSPGKTYCGEIDPHFRLHGKGCLRDELHGTVFYGNFDSGIPVGVGIQEYPDNHWEPAIFDGKTFHSTMHFNPEDLKPFLNKTFDEAFYDNKSNPMTVATPQKSKKKIEKEKIDEQKDNPALKPEEPISDSKKDSK